MGLRQKDTRVRSSDMGLNHPAERPRLPDKAIRRRHLSDARIRDDLSLQTQTVGSRMESRSVSNRRKVLELTRRRGFEGHSNMKHLGPHGLGQSQKSRVYRNGMGHTFEYVKDSVGLNEGRPRLGLRRGDEGSSRLAQRRRGFHDVSGTTHQEPSKPRPRLPSRQGTFTGKKYRAVHTGLQEGSCMLDYGRGFTSGPGK
ncbi:hypothetical protein F0562_028211 [Nyssa sinensis]|uniref:Uncharacterized protein n=1 Tax=Nyssa sinensis TaxID=561372 RepID=A0A5J5B5R5_9ASTE|nr:hypothetical protein F0562_028211 [Nyssa sinensis]